MLILYDQIVSQGKDSHCNIVHPLQNSRFDKDVEELTETLKQKEVEIEKLKAKLKDQNVRIQALEKKEKEREEEEERIKLLKEFFNVALLFGSKGNSKSNDCE